MKNTERLFVRMTPDLKKDVQLQAKKNNLKTSEYIRKLLESAIHGLPHEQLIEYALKENTFINELLLDPNLGNEAKQIITERMRDYV